VPTLNMDTSTYIRCVVPGAHLRCPSIIRIALALLAVGAMFALSLFLVNSAYMHLTVAYKTMLSAMLPEMSPGVEACALRCPVHSDTEHFKADGCAR
jgi:hypothetical protein